MNKVVGFDEAVKRFQAGEVGIFPTDTAYGIGCRIDREDSIRRVYDIRNRPSEKALLALVSSVEMAQEYVDLNKISKSLIEKYWPGGLTIICKCKASKVHEIVRASGETLAVRMPDHKEMLQLIEEVSVPIVAPSANLSGAPTPFTLAEVSEEIQQSVDFILEGMCTIKGVSTIVDVTKDPISLVRDGVIKIENVV